MEWPAVLVFLGLLELADAACLLRFLRLFGRARLARWVAAAVLAPLRLSPGPALGLGFPRGDSAWPSL